MDSVSVRDFGTQPGKVWEKLARQHELVVTRDGKPFAVLTETSSTSLYADPDSLPGARFGQVLEAAWEASKQAGTSEMSMEAIIAEIAAARRDNQAAAGI